MILLVDLLLLINIYWAYKSFKNFISPPFVLGLGMFLASVVATLYYDEWQMNNMLYESAFILSFCPLFFTLCCILLRQKKQQRIIVSSAFDVSAYKKPIVVLVAMSVVNCLIKVKLYQSAFGSYLNFSELLNSVRMDAWSGENTFSYPQIVVWMTAISVYFSYVTSWVLSICLITKDKEDKWLKYLCLAHLVITAFDGLLYGAKGSMLEPIVRFVVIYLSLCYVLKPDFKINTKLWVKMFAAALVFMLSFTALTEFVGRETSQNNSTLLAVYCGAEIKNFDIYMHRKEEDNKKSDFGVMTFSHLYQEITGKDKRGIGEFQTVGNYSLGNVYTQYRDFHKDFGVLGTFIMTFLSAVVVMFVYNRAWRNNNKINIFLLLYAPMAFWLFMSFFSNTFVNTVFRIGYLKALFYICLFIFISNTYFVKSYEKS